jgi:hypothetical protein
MTQVTGINYGKTTTISPVVTQTRPPATPQPTAPGWPVDTVELCGMTVSQALARLEEPRLNEIRKQITAGTYLNEDKLNTVYDRLTALVERLRAENARGTE